MRKILKLRHHKHTGKLLPHRHTSYRALFLLLSLLGTTLISTTQTALADDLVVTAKVPADPPTVPAIITQPPDGTIVHVPNITVSGSCEAVDPVTIIQIYSGTHFLGSTTCSGDDNFTIIVTLRPGLNPLKARSSSITEDFGPDSSIVNVTYQPLGEEGNPVPAPVVGPNNPSLPGTPGIPAITVPLEIRSQPVFIQFSQQKDAVWHGSVWGGAQPYNLTMDWGDGQQKRREGLGSEKVTFTHRYEQMQTYFVKITAADTSGQTVTQQIAAVSLKQSSTIVQNLLSRVSFPSAFAQIYIAYVLLLIFFTLVWYDARVLKLQFVPISISGRRERRK